MGCGLNIRNLDVIHFEKRGGKMMRFTSQRNNPYVGQLELGSAGATIHFGDVSIDVEIATILRALGLKKDEEFKDDTWLVQRSGSSHFSKRVLAADTGILFRVRANGDLFIVARKSLWMQARRAGII
jgi:hypothetical protein